MSGNAYEYPFDHWIAGFLLGGTSAFVKTDVPILNQRSLADEKELSQVLLATFIHAYSYCGLQHYAETENWLSGGKNLRDGFVAGFSFMHRMPNKMILFAQN